MYEDFFGPREPVKKTEPIPSFRQELKDDDLDGYYSTPAALPPSPTFDIVQPAAADLFQDNMTTNLSSFERSQEKLTSRINALEGQAVADKAWQLAGESTAKSRPVNALLGESDLGIDYASKPVPIISVDSTLGLEERIKARIKDGIFDSVERRIVAVERRRTKKDRTGEDEKNSESLVQVYEKEYLRQTAKVKQVGVVVEEESKEEIEAVKLFTALCDQLDALSNSHYTPVREEVGGMEIVVQAPAISVEEVIPGHVSNAQLVAPGDVYRAGLKMSKGEMEAGDRRREKRSKKAKGRKEGATKETVGKVDGGSAVKELLGMDNVTMIKGSDGKVGDDKGGKKRKAKVLEQGGEIGAKAARTSANFIRL
jgi:U3 small nucleolar RNA-associated protein MPP10